MNEWPTFSTEYQVRTTDGRYVRVSPDAWWDATGTDLCSNDVVDAYLDANPTVGVFTTPR